MSGWEPSKITRYEYDTDGQLVGSVTELEPEWSRADVESLIAFLENQRVGPHGHPISEATSRDGDPSNHDRLFDWVLNPPVKDFAQTVVNAGIEAFKRDYPNVNPNEYRFSVSQVFRGSRSGG